MTSEENVAYVISQSVAAMITAMGMAAENKQREACGHSMAYVEGDFQRIITDSDIGCNDVIGRFCH